MLMLLACADAAHRCCCQSAAGRPALLHAHQVLVLGCGSTAQPLPKDVAQYLSSKGIKVEVLDSVSAEVVHFSQVLLIQPKEFDSLPGSVSVLLTYSVVGPGLCEYETSMSMRPV
jgi:hypothetical protein